MAVNCLDQLKQKSVVIAIISSYAIGCSGEDRSITPDEIVNTVNLSESIYIKFLSKNGWSLLVMPDGSGSFSYGSLPLDGATFPSGTIDYTSVYDDVSPNLRNSPRAFRETSIAVVIGEKGRVSHNALYFDGENYWNELVRRLKTELKPYSTSRFNELISQNPLELAAPLDKTRRIDNLSSP